MDPKGRSVGRGFPRVVIILVAAVLLLVVGVGAASMLRQEPKMVTVPDAGGAYVEAAVGNPNYINPVLLQFNSVDRDISSLVFSGLTRFDENGLIGPDLAERWELGDGGKSYTFFLRRDVRWHDRTPFTADDVVFTVKAIQAKDYQGSPEVGELWRTATVDELDDYTVRFTLKEPFAPFLEYTTVGILPKHLYAENLGKAMLTSSYNLRPVGTGPFKLTTISAQEAVLEPSSDYYGPMPYLKQVRFRFYPDYQSALAALDQGEVDGLPYLDSQDVAKLQSNEKISVYSAPDYLRYCVLFLNTNTPVFKEKAVRQAVALAIDREKLVQTVLDGQGVAGGGPISPASWAYESKVKSYPYDPQQAQSILDAAGWKDSNGDGIRDKDGVSLSMVVLTNDNKRRVRTGEMVAEDLKKIGFKAEVQAPAWADLLREYLAPRTFLGAIAEQWLLTADPDVYSLWHSSNIGGGGFNFSGMSNKTADKLLEDARRATDRDQRVKLYSEFQQLWAEECPAVVLYYPKFNWAVSKNLKDVKLSVLVDGSSRFRHVSQWHIKTKQVPETAR